MAANIERPAAGEYRDYAFEYISLMPEDGRLLEHLETNARRLEALLRAYPASRLTTPHAPGEWTPQDVLLHIMDTERVFAYRALCLARGETAALPGFEQDDYARAAGANSRSLEGLLAEYRAVRAASIALLRSFDDAALDRRGIADANPLSVRAAAYMVAGHELYHRRSVLENYGTAGLRSWRLAGGVHNIVNRQTALRYGGNMPASVGKRYVAQSGAEVIVTKGGPGELSDGEVALMLKDEAPAGTTDGSGRAEPMIELGKRYKSPDGEVELLVIKAGVCDLRYNGSTMEILQPKILPSAD